MLCKLSPAQLTTILRMIQHDELYDEVHHVS